MHKQFLWFMKILLMSLLLQPQILLGHAEVVINNPVAAQTVGGRVTSSRWQPTSGGLRLQMERFAQGGTSISPLPGLNITRNLASLNITRWDRILPFGTWELDNAIPSGYGRLSHGAYFTSVAAGLPFWKLDVDFILRQGWGYWSGVGSQCGTLVEGLTFLDSDIHVVGMEVRVTELVGQCPPMFTFILSDNSRITFLPPDNSSTVLEWAWDQLDPINFKVVAPILTEGTDAIRYVGDQAEWYDTVFATWGVSIHRTIPSDGQVKVTAASETMMDFFTEHSNTISKIGKFDMHFTVRDTHSLTNSGIYIFDNTYAVGARHFVLKTTASPVLDMKYDSAASPGCSGQTYDPSSILPCGGESGWTREPLEITVSPTGIQGIFDTLLIVGSSTYTSSHAAVSITAYADESTTIAGTPVRGVLTNVADANVELSEPSNATVRIDRTPPVPRMERFADGTFADSSFDALSGLSATRPSKIAFTTVGGPQPAPSAFTTFDSITVAPGTYDVWVWATDRAGNEAIAMVEGGVYVAGEVCITKESTLGATLHASTCSNQDNVSKDASCDSSCTVGASADVAGNTEITYLLTVKNTDNTLLGKGNFLDYLPLGIDLNGPPTVTSSGGETVTIHSTTKVSGGTYDGRWQITGDFEGLAPGDSFIVSITCYVPAYDDAPGATNIISNQATGTWELAAVSSGTMESNYANHRVNPSPIIINATNWGAANHTEGCIETTSLTLTGNCNTDCIAGDSGYVQPGDIVSYELTFDNPSNILQYFATSGAARNYDIFPVGIDATGQTITIDLINSGGTRTNQYTGVVAPGITGTIYTGSWPDADGNYLSGLAVSGERIYQSTGTISVAPKSKLIITVRAAVTGNIGDTLSNQVITGHSATGNNANTLAITDAGVTTIRSNHVTHQIEQGTILRKWAYSNTADANNPTVHIVGCPDAGNLLVPGTCLGCTLGNAKLQKDTVVTYSLTMDNTKNLHTGSNLAGNIAGGIAIPGGYIDNNHRDVVIPEGLIVAPTTLRVYVTDKTGASVPITNGGGTFSSPQNVNENGTTVIREVLSITGTNIDIKDTGEGTNIFTLSNISLVDNGTRWELNLDNRAYANGTTNDYTGYSITYLFDATVTGEYDSVTLANNTWVNHWKQDNGNRVHDPENPVATAVIPAGILSNTVVHARLSDAVDTLFTKVGADNITQGLSGAQFALYKWDGTNPPTEAQARHMVDSSVLVDTATMPAGSWVRVQKNAAIATLTDVFVSDTSPQGEVDLGKLPTGTYTLIETKAPSGYALPVGQWILTVDSDKTDAGAGQWKIEFAGKSNSIVPPAAVRDTGGAEPTYRIINARPFLIGMSGLSGTTGLLLTGFVIMVLVSNIYLVHRYKQGYKIKKQRKIETL
jgi:Cna protein B-type domain.